MQSVKFAVAFLNRVLPAIHQHVNSEDLKRGKFEHKRQHARTFCPCGTLALSEEPHVSPPDNFNTPKEASVSDLLTGNV